MWWLIVIAIISVCLLFLMAKAGRKSEYGIDFERYQDEKFKEFEESAVDDVVS